MDRLTAWFTAKMRLCARPGSPFLPGCFGRANEGRKRGNLYAGGIVGQLPWAGGLADVLL